MEIDVDFALITAVGPILTLTVLCFFLAFVAEFASDREILSVSVPEDESAQQI
jgi:hypothetical protein